MFDGQGEEYLCRLVKELQTVCAAQGFPKPADCSLIYASASAAVSLLISVWQILCIQAFVIVRAAQYRIFPVLSQIFPSM